MSLATTNAPTIQPAPARPRSKSRGATSSQEPVKPKKVSLYLTPEALRRLDVHVAMEGGDRSRLVEQLVQGGLRRYEMPRRRSDATLMVGESAEAGPVE